MNIYDEYCPGSKDDSFGPHIFEIIGLFVLLKQYL